MASDAPGSHAQNRGSPLWRRQRSRTSRSGNVRSVRRPVLRLIARVGGVCKFELRVFIFEQAAEGSKNGASAHSQLFTLLTFAGWRLGIVYLVFQSIERIFLTEPPRPVRQHRVYATTVVGTAVLPILLAGLAQLYVFYELQNSLGEALVAGQRSASMP
jgi:hypothetical protein